jgi:hypothetical protein
MRRVVALLLSCFLIAATAEGGTLRCVSMTASLGGSHGSHGCCDDQQALSPAAPPCCIVSPASQPRSTESQTVVAQGGAPCESPVVLLGAGDGSPRTLGVWLPPRTTGSSVPIYLQQLSLLI